MEDLTELTAAELAAAVEGYAETIEMLDKLVERKRHEVENLNDRIARITESRKRYLAESVRRKQQASP